MRRHRFAAAFLAVSALASAHAACVGDDPGSTTATPDGGANDAGADRSTGETDAGGEDALFDGPCDPAKDFGAPDPAPFVNVNRAGERDDWPYVLPNELTVYFSSPRPDGDGGSSFEIYRATRGSIGEAFGAVERVVGVNAPGLVEDLAPVVAPDERTIFWTRFAPGVTQEYDGYFATRQTSQLPWGEPTPISFSGAGSDGPSDFVKDEIWYEANGKLFHAPWSGAAAGTGVEITELGPGAGSVHPTADGLRIYYTTDNAGTGHDIWTARRPTFADKFTDLQSVSSVNSSSDEFVGSVSPDGCRLYMQSNRTPDGKADLYVATKPR